MTKVDNSRVIEKQSMIIADLALQVATLQAALDVTQEELNAFKAAGENKKEQKNEQA